MTSIGPDSPADLLGLVRAARPPVGPGAPVPPEAIAWTPAADGFRPDDGVALVAVRHLLQETLADAGPPEQLARRLLEALFDFLPEQAPVPRTPPSPPSRGLPVPPSVPLTAPPGPGAAPPIVPAVHPPELGPPVAPPPPSAGTAATPLTRAELRALLPADAAHEPVARALRWLVEHVDQPPALAAAAVELGPALQQLGVAPQRLDALGVLLADAMRANAGPGWRPEHDQARRATTKLVARWIGEGMARIAYEPPFWTATVVAHERRLVRLRTYLPYPCTPGQYATVETPQHPQRWGQFWIANLPAGDNEVVLRVDATGGDEVAVALAESTAVGDRVRLRPAQGGLDVDPESDRDLLLVAYDAGIAPIATVLADLRRYRRVGGVHLLWGAATEDEFEDLAEVRELAGPDATVEPVVSTGPLLDAVARGDWQEYEVYIAGAGDVVRATLRTLDAAAVPPERIRHVMM